MPGAGIRGLPDAMERDWKCARFIQGNRSGRNIASPKLRKRYPFATACR